MEATPRQRVVRSLPIANSPFYTFYTKNITTLHFEDYRQRTRVGAAAGTMELRIYGIMELRKLCLYNELCGASQ